MKWYNCTDCIVVQTYAGTGEYCVGTDEYDLGQATHAHASLSPHKASNDADATFTKYSMYEMNWLTFGCVYCTDYIQIIAEFGSFEHFQIARQIDMMNLVQSHNTVVLLTMCNKSFKQLAAHLTMQW